MVHLTERASKSTASIYRIMREKHDSMKADGCSVIDFTLGSPTQPIFESILDAGINHLHGIKGGAEDYTSFQGSAKLREDLAQIFNKAHGTNYTGKNFVLTVGANDCIRQSFQILAEIDEPVLLHDPGFSSYPAMLKMLGRRAFIFSTADSGFAVEPNKLDRAIEEMYSRQVGTGVPRDQFHFTFLFTDPGNPTGYKHSNEELEAISKVFLEKWKSANVIVDGLYTPLSHDPSRNKTLHDIFVGTHMENNCIFVDSASKADGLAGERIGYGVCKDERYASALANDQLLGPVHPSTAAQVMLIEAIAKRELYSRDNADEYSRKTNIVYNKLKPLGIMNYQPNGAFYSLVDLGFMKDVPVSEETLKQYQRFYHEKDVSGTSVVGSSPFLAGMELAERTGIVTVPMIKSDGKGIRHFSEDQGKSELAIVRIVPTNTVDELMAAYRRMREYSEYVKAGDVDYKIDIRTPKENIQSFTQKPALLQESLDKFRAQQVSGFAIGGNGSNND